MSLTSQQVRTGLEKLIAAAREQRNYSPFTPVMTTWTLSLFDREVLGGRTATDEEEQLIIAALAEDTTQGHLDVVDQVWKADKAAKREYRRYLLAIMNKEFPPRPVICR